MEVGKFSGEYAGGGRAGVWRGTGERLMQDEIAVLPEFMLQTLGWIPTNQTEGVGPGPPSALLPHSQLPDSLNHHNGKLPFRSQNFRQRL